MARHSDPKLTTNVYTDPRLLDVAGALDSLLALRLDADAKANRERVEQAAHGDIRRGSRCTHHRQFEQIAGKN